MDLINTVAQYAQVSMALNMFALQPDGGLVMDCDLDRTLRHA